MKAFGRWWWAGLFLAVGLAVTLPAVADPLEHSEEVCRVTVEIDPETDEGEPITSYIHTEEQDAGSTVNVNALHIQIASSRCFYLGSRFTRWVHLGYGEDGHLKYGWSPDGRPGGHIVIGTCLLVRGRGWRERK